MKYKEYIVKSDLNKIKDGCRLLAGAITSKNSL